MTYFLRKSRMDIKFRENLSFLFIVLIFASSLILVTNFKVINDTREINEQTQILSADSDIIWDKTWGDYEADGGFAVWTNGTFIYTSGSTESFGEGNRDLLLIKWDTEGNQIWNRTWGGTEQDVSNAIWGNGTFIYTSGSTESFGEGNRDLLLIKWDAEGNQIWNRTWGGIFNDCSNSIWGNGTFIYSAGYTSSFGSGNDDLLLIKWDYGGNQIWNRTWGGTDDDHGYAVKGNENFLYTSGNTNSFGEGHSDLLNVKWDTEGNQIWNRTWGDIENQESQSLWCDDTYFYNTGSSGNITEDDIKLVLIKWDYEGNQIWNKTHSIQDLTIGLSIWCDGTYLYITGATIYSFSFESALIFMVWDTDGNIISEKTWSESNIGIGYSICGDNSNFYICGAMDFSDGNSFELLLLKGSLFSLSKPFLRYIRPDPDLDGNVTLNWDVVEAATSYNIYRDSSNIDDFSSLVSIGSTTSLTYTDYGLSNGTYYYVIVATRDSLISPISNCEAVLVEISPESGDNEEIIPGYPIGLFISILSIFIVSFSVKRYRELS